MTERIDIVVNERGSRVVRRNIEGIGNSARSAEGGVRLLRRALGVLSVSLGVREVSRLADTYTNLQNRIRTVTNSQTELLTATDELFRISNATRSSFEATAEVYTRTALAARDLGISQRETLNFTESLNQAVILSGASATEAQAGLIQLSQGLASGALRGDELRSVLEQLPVVADVIADSLGVTRGELRELGSQGLITSQDIITAFREAREELVERFAETIPTLSQSFQVLQNNLVLFFGQLGQSSGVLDALSGSIVLFANNLETASDLIVLVGVAIGVSLSGSLQSAAAAQLRLTAAVASGNAVLVQGLRADEQRARLSVQQTTAARTQAAQQVNLAQATLASTQAQIEAAIADNQRLAVQRNLTTSSNQFAASSFRSAQANSALQASLTRVGELSRVQQQNVAALAAAEGQLAAATNAATSSQAAHQVAIARTGVVARVAAGSIAFLSRAMAFLGGPLGVVTLAASAFFLFRDNAQSVRQEVDQDRLSLMNLNNILQETTFQTQSAATSALGEAQAILQRRTARLEELRTERQIALERAQRARQQANTVTRSTGGGQFSGVSAFVNANRQLNSANSALSLLDTNIANINEDIRISDENIAALGRQIARLDERNNIQNFERQLVSLRNIIEPAAVATERLADQEVVLNQALEDGRITTVNAQQALSILRAEFEESINPLGVVIRNLEQRAELSERIQGLSRSEAAVERQVAQTLSNLAQVNIELSQAEEDRIRSLIARNVAATQEAQNNTRLIDQLNSIRQATQSVSELSFQLSNRQDILNAALEQGIIDQAEYTNLLTLSRREILGISNSVQTYANNIAQLTSALDDGVISQTEFNDQQRLLRLEVLQTATSLEAGLARGLLQASIDFNDFASVAESAVTRAFGGAEDAIVNFVRTGRLSFSSLIDSVLSDLARLAARQFLLGPLANLFGLGGGLGSIFNSLPGFQTGADFTVGGSGGPDSQLVAFRASPNERVQVTTPEQDRASGGSNVRLEITQNITTQPGQNNQEVANIARQEIEQVLDTQFRRGGRFESIAQ